MKYEFIRLTDEFKEKYSFYNENKNRCIDLTKLIEKNRNLRFPVSVFINGVLLESKFYNYENRILTITDESYNLPDNDDNPDLKFSTNRVYLIMGSVDSINSGYIKQYICKNFATFGDDSIIAEDGDFEFANYKSIIGISINGIIYGSECFNNPEYSLDLGFVDGDGKPVLKDKITFLEPHYRPDESDDVSILIIDRR